MEPQAVKVETLTMNNLCFICLSAISTTSDHRDHYHLYSQNENAKWGKYSFSSAKVKVLTSYILQKETINGERNNLQKDIMLSLETGGFFICDDCLDKADNLMELHLELEKVQMQILDLLKNLQKCISQKSREETGNEIELRDDVILSRFQDVLHNEFIHRDLSEGTQISLERLNIAGYRHSFPLIPKPLDEFKNKNSPGLKQKRTSRRSIVKTYEPETIDDKDYIPSDDYDDNQDDPKEECKPLQIQTKRGRGRPRTRDRNRSKILLWDCDICLENIPYKEMESHLRTHSEFEEYYKCEYCPHKKYTRLYGTFKGLIWHYLRSQHIIKVPCKLCPDQNQNQSIVFGRRELCKHLYDNHYHSHKRLQCKYEDCLEEFYDHITRRYHYERDHSEIHTCHICKKEFKTGYSLKVHTEGVHGDKGERYYCASCPKNFKNQLGLKRHERSCHDESELVKCPHCPKTFAGHALNQHVKYVHGEKSLQCQFCEKTFTKTNNLKRHEDSHSTEKKYKCGKCEYLGTTSLSLKLHMRIHDEKAWKCRYCAKAFAVKVYREDHERCHTKETPFNCEFCGKAFRRRPALRKHRIKIHGYVSVRRSGARVDAEDDVLKE